MGVNRKEIAGCQIPEALELFTKYVKNGKVPPKTKNSFIVPADWIKQIGPRLKERIATETTEQQKIKFNEKREKEVGKLDGQFKNGKITEKEYKEKIWQFDNVVENNIQNEIAKRIEKAHSYSFNLQNYKSILSNDQIKKWQAAFKGIKIKNGANIDAQFQELLSADSKTALQILASFDSESALEMDIAREYLSKAKKKEKKMLELEEILKENHEYPLISLTDLLISNENKIKPKKYPNEQFTVLGVSNIGGVFVNEKKKGSEIDQSYFVVEKNQFCYNPYRINVGSIGLNNFENGSRQIISGAYVIFGVNENEIDPRYLLALLGSKKFNKYVNDQATGGVRMNFKFEYLQNWKIPLPSLEIQQEIVKKVERQKEIVDGVDKIISSFSSDNFLDFSFKKVSIDNKVAVDGSPIKDLSNFQDEIYVGGENIDSGTGILKNIKTVKELGVKGPSYIFKNGHVVYSKVRPNLRKCFYASFNGICSSDIYPLKTNLKILDPQYLTLVLQSKYFSEQTQSFQEGRLGMPKINQDQLVQIKIPLPSLEIQKRIVAQSDKEMETLEKISDLKRQAKKGINKILEEVWGE